MPNPAGAKDSHMRYPFKVCQILLVCFSCVFMSGCWFLVVGGAGAVGGYAISRDTFEGVTNKSPEELLAAAHKVLSIMGTIINEEAKGGKIEAIVYGNHVWVSVIEVNMTTSRLRVKARKNMFPSAGVAQDIYTKIINQLEQKESE